MDLLLQFLTQPLVIVLIAIGVFVGRVVYLAKRLKSASRNLVLADPHALDRHRESLEEAKGTLTGNLGAARETLRTYREPLDTAVEDRRKGLETSIKNLAPGKELERIRSHSAYKEAKKLVKTSLPRKTHRSPTKEM